MSTTLTLPTSIAGSTYPAPSRTSVAAPDRSSAIICPIPIAGSQMATFEQFCADHYGTVSNALGWALGSNDLGGEAADEAFARAFERWAKVGAMQNPAGWVYRVGLNWGKRRQWRRGREIELLSSRRPPTHHEDSFSDPDLANAVAELPMKLRSVVVARMILDQSEADTAAALGISPGTVKSRLHRGLAKLRLQLGEDQGLEPNGGAQ